MSDRKIIYLDDALDALEKVAELFPWKVPGNRDSYDRYNEAWNDAMGRAEIEIEKLPSAQPDAVTASLEELINDYGEDGYFTVDGVDYQANELLNELKTNSSVGEKFRKQITKTIVAYFMKFGD